MCTLFGFNELRFFLVTSPAFEKSRSLIGTEVLGIIKNSRAMVASPGNRARFAFHQMEGHCDLSIKFSVT
jgi:hypothetical protein